MVKICTCGCKKGDHHDSLDWGKNKGECKNCGWGECESFSEKKCHKKDCQTDRVIYYIYCQKHLDEDNS